VGADAVPSGIGVIGPRVLAHIPNLISLLRLLAVPLVVYLVLHENFVAGFWLFVAAGVSDAIDGYIAKRFRASSQLGRYLDPLADKVLLVSLFVVGGYMDFLPDWLVILVVFRDAMIVGGALLFQTFDHPPTMPPLAISKLNTALQIVLVAVALVFKGYQLNWLSAQIALEYLVGATTLASGGAYLVKWGRLAATIEGDDRK
jgi:cardiolipin synthase